MSRVRVLAGAGIVLVLCGGSAVAQEAPVNRFEPTMSRAETGPTGRVLHPILGVNLSGVTAERTSLLVPADRPFVGSGRLGQSAESRTELELSPAVLAALQEQAKKRSPGVVLMIVGAAGIITGLLVDEAIVTVAGAGVGLYGLYLYLR